MVINTPLAALAGVRELTSGLQFRRLHPCLSTLLNSSQTHTVVFTFCSQQPLAGAITCARAAKSQPGTAALHTPSLVIKFNPDFTQVGKNPHAYSERCLEKDQRLHPSPIFAYEKEFLIQFESDIWSHPFLLRKQTVFLKTANGSVSGKIRHIAL